MKIKVKLILLVSLLITGLIITGLLSARQLKGAGEAYLEMQEDEDIQLMLKSLQYRITGLSNDERSLLLTGDEELISGMADKVEEINGYFENLLKMRHLDKEPINKIKENFLVYKEANNKMVEAFLGGEREKAYKIHFEDERSIRKELLDPSIEVIISGITSEINNDKILLAKKQKTEAYILISTILLSTIAGIIIAFFIIRSISKPITIMNARLKEIAEGEGDLTQTIDLDSRDELGEMACSFNNMIGKLRELIIQVGYSAEQVAAASEQLTASSEETTRATEQIALTVQEVAIGTAKQAESVKGTSITVHEMSTSLSQFGTSSEVVKSTALHTSEKAVEGNKAVATIVAQMNEINETVQELSVMVKTLGARSNQIGKIVAAITGIAEQTNLLALNAAIEAARAGEHGRGFAVVADEVRKLAEQSAGSAQEISQLISTIQSDTNETVKAMEDTTNKVTEGINFVHDAGKLFEQIKQAVLEVTSQIQEAVSDVQKMAVGAEQMAQSVELIAETADLAAIGTQNMSAATEEQLASMEEITASSSSLSKMAEELNEIVRKFKV
ncbi:methyl-accepting chemotaxis protein [Schinkia azotoformans]|uniref:methyl-accepting chemotaxis protein n=1 Tax=Schinkia azotoformans TaxID=1454 RepID=UPI002DBC4840|nr:methyl-accepting chemotaxis protein [Schinkia azotoformans]MEC1720004.1 methyl-accepting chemotaxis protein [Schinkia azotoformans]MED4354167.1 methyl-accepting chemotaxis protein [Schinkia azotoformans]MED4415664.1 methyl-accepting chemotaxis protein [Schinkia azotoformans]